MCLSLVRNVMKSLEEKSEKQERLKSKLAELKKANSLQEEELTSRLQSAEDELESIQEQKRRVTGTFRMNIHKLEADMSQTQDSIRESQRLLRQLEQRSRKVELIMNQEQNEKLENFRKSLRPLEEAVELVVDEKKTTEDNIASLKSQLAELEGKLSTLSAEESHNRKQIDTLQANKVELSAAFETIKKKYPLEYDEIVKEIETKKTLAEIKERKNKQATELRELDKQINEKERDLSKAVSDLEREERQRSHNRKSGADEDNLLEVENYLRLRCKENNISYIDKAVDEVSEKYGIDLNDCILKEQFKIMEDRELALIERGKEQQELMEMEVSRKTLECEHLEQKSLNDSSHSRKLRDLQEQICRLKKEAAVSQRRHACHIAFITKWKDENRKCLLMPENISWPNDLNIIDSIRNEMSQKILEKSLYSAIDSILSRYIKTLNKREGLANAASEVEVKASHKIKEKESYIKELKSGISSLQFEREILHKDYVRLLNLEKSTLKKFQKAKFQIEVERYRLINKRQL